jgi:cytochrome c peroxidase
VSLTRASTRTFAAVLGTAALVASTWAVAGYSAVTARWSAAELATLREMSLANLPALEKDPSNRVSDDAVAAALGRDLFFDQRLSGNGQVSCGTCHLPDREFQDGTPLAHGTGTTARRTMPVAGSAHSAWFFWDGRADSQWAQALGPLESPVEHGGDRTQYAQVVAANYRERYERVFGRLPALTDLPEKAGPVADPGRRAAWERIPAVRQEVISRVYANIGKAIAAFERRIDHAPTRFDRYVAVELAKGTHTPTSAFSKDEEAGLRLFIGKANCVTCHNGARLSDESFHNTGVAASPMVAEVDSGRTAGVRQAIAGEFNCLSRYSDARPEQCSELRFARTTGKELVRAYKTPTLRGVAERAPYMHAGQLASLADVIAHYDRAPAASAGHSELTPLKLNARERAQLEAFLRTLSAPPLVRP